MALILAPLFIYCAVIQLNDPDPLLWAVIYGVAAVVMGWHVFRPPPRVSYLVVGSISLIAFVCLLPSVLREAVFQGTEIERELLGMLVTSMVMAIFWACARVDSSESIE